MKVATAIKLLSELPLDAEICGQWYEKQDLEYNEEAIPDEVWLRANFIIDKWECSDLRYQLDDALALAKQQIAQEVLG